MVDVFYECYKKEAHVVKDCGCFRTNLEILCVAAEIPLRSKVNAFDFIAECYW